MENKMTITEVYLMAHRTAIDEWYREVERHQSRPNSKICKAREENAWAKLKELEAWGEEQGLTW